jgi:glycerophosphoryl diester phosphodiesterase
MIDLHRKDGRVLRIGHRGAAALAPENTLRGFATAVELGVDLIELDVLDLRDGTLVVAHSDDLLEVSHGAAAGRVRDRSLAELRAVAHELPTFDEALAFFAEQAPHVGLHVDLKLRRHEEDAALALRRAGLAERTVVSSNSTASLRAIARAADGIRIGFTYPHDRRGLSKYPPLAPFVYGAIFVWRALLPRRVGSLLARASATALMLHHTVVSAAAVDRAHALGAAVCTWTVDDRPTLARVEAAGVDAVITNDPRIFRPEAVATLSA